MIMSKYLITLQCKTLGYIYIISWKLAEKQ